MGGVIISPKMKRTKEMINTNGDVINPETKEIVQKNDPGYIPTKEEVEAKINIPAEPVKVPDQVKALNPLAVMIKKQIQEQVAQMVKQAFEEAFK